MRSAIRPLAAVVVLHLALWAGAAHGVPGVPPLCLGAPLHLRTAAPRATGLRPSPRLVSSSGAGSAFRSRP